MHRKKERIQKENKWEKCTLNLERFYRGRVLIDGKWPTFSVLFFLFGVFSWKYIGRFSLGTWTCFLIHTIFTTSFFLFNPNKHKEEKNVYITIINLIILCYFTIKNFWSFVSFGKPHKSNSVYKIRCKWKSLKKDGWKDIII